MVLIMVMFHVLVTALCIGAIVSVVVFVPMTIYTIPYLLWVGNENTKGKHLDKKKESAFRSARNATRLYKAKLTGHEPIF